MIRKVQLSVKRTPQIKAYENALKQARKSRHVILNGEKWVVKASASKKPSGFFKTQADAISAAKKTTSQTNGKVFVHARNGRIRKRL